MRTLGQVPRRFPLPLSILDAVREEQDDVVRRSQLHGLGIGRDKVRREVQAGRWQTIGQTVVILHSGPLTDQQRLWVAVLSQPGTAALAGLTAATAQGLRWSGETGIHVVTAYGSRAQPLDGVTCHISRRLVVDDLHPVHQPPMVRLDRALIDAATWSTSSRTACGLLAAGVQQRLTTAPRLKAELNTAGLVRHRHLLSLCLDDIEGGADSLAEIDFTALAAAAGIPAPLRQRKRKDNDGKTRYVDVDLGGFDAEVDGALHLRPLTYWEDMSRQNDLVISNGRPMLRFSSLALRIDKPTVRRQLKTAYERWGGPQLQLPA